MIADGRRVTLEYTLTKDDGEVAETNVGGEPLVYVQGAQQMLPALEEALAGLRPGDEKKVRLSPEQGYGPRDASLLETVPLDSVPEAAREAGTELIAQSSEGKRSLVRVQEVREDEIVIDLNHPMAGETLHFALRVIAVE